MAEKKTYAFRTSAAKAPEDHKKSLDEIFEVETSAGVLKLKRMQLPAEYIFYRENVSERDATRMLIEENLDEEQRKILMSLDSMGEGSEFNEVMEYWRKVSGINLGESMPS